jgi:hypothetical protein
MIVVAAHFRDDLPHADERDESSSKRSVNGYESAILSEMQGRAR